MGGGGKVRRGAEPSAGVGVGLGTGLGASLGSGFGASVLRVG